MYVYAQTHEDKPDILSLQGLCWDWTPCKLISKLGFQRLLEKRASASLPSLYWK